MDKSDVVSSAAQTKVPAAAEENQRPEFSAETVTVLRYLELSPIRLGTGQRDPGS